MTALLRSCSVELAAALDAGTIRAEADLFTIRLADGVTVLRWTSWDRDLRFGGDAWTSANPWLECSGWEVSNTIEVPSMKLMLRAGNAGFNGGANIKAQINQGLFDGATVLLTQAYMAELGTILGTIDMFLGKIGALDVDGAKVEMTAKGKVNDLDQYAPRNLFQVSCNHAFCDAGCTLSRATYTASYTMGASPGTSFIPWASAPANPARYQGGTLAVSTGPASGSRRTIDKATSGGLTLAYPLLTAPAAGSSFTAFEGCDKSYDSGSVQSCTARSNTQHHRGFSFIPPPTTVV